MDNLSFLKRFIIMINILLLAFITQSCSIKAKEPQQVWKCNDSVGLDLPVPVCSKENPCKRLLPTYKFLNPPVKIITEASQGKPLCGTGPRGKRIGRPFYKDNTKSVTTKKDDMLRYYCEYQPQIKKEGSKLPVVIFVHGSGGYGGSVYDTTSLRGKADKYNLSDDPENKGFILISLQSRNLHWPTKDPEDGAKFDSFHRNFKMNPDVDYLDKVIDQTISTGKADPKRIYLMGWSNGARFSAFYALSRHHQPTPGGNRIAAIANYSGGDPYENIQKDYNPSCKLKVYPQSTLPLYMISRSCDGVACDEAQAENLRSGKTEISPGNVAGSWIKTLKEKIKDPNVVWQKINYYAKPVNNCTLAVLCNPIIAVRNHFFWPDGVEDKSHNDWEPEMLDFLKNNPIK